MGGKDRAAEAAGLATSSPLLDSQFTAAKAVVFNICGPPDLTLAEVNAAAGVIYENVAADANIIFGASVDENKGQDVSVTVLATGFETGLMDALGMRCPPRGACPTSAVNRQRRRRRRLQLIRWRRRRSRASSSGSAASSSPRVSGGRLF